MKQRQTRIDLKKELGALYRPSRTEVVEVTAPPLRYLMIDGQGDPNTSAAYKDAVEALFSVSYTARFAMKKRPPGTDYAVMPLEGLWWAHDMSAFSVEDKSNWLWTLMILQPDFVDDSVIRDAIERVRDNKGLPATERLRLEVFAEGRCAQVVHVGPFTEEGPTIQRLHAFIAERAALRGKHHEIYLSDIRRANPRNWKTIIRQPMGP